MSWDKGFPNFAVGDSGVHMPGAATENWRKSQVTRSSGYDETTELTKEILIGKMTALAASTNIDAEEIKVRMQIYVTLARMNGWDETLNNYYYIMNSCLVIGTDESLNKCDRVAAFDVARQSLTDYLSFTHET